MKKLLTILVLLLAAVSNIWAEEYSTTIYPNHDVGSTWNALQIDYNSIYGIAKDDKITVYIEKDSRMPDVQLQYQYIDINNQKVWAGANLNATKAANGESYEFTMTAESAGFYTSNSSNLIVTGQNYTITKVTWTHGETTKTLFGDPFELYNWGGTSVAKSWFEDVAVGDVLKATLNIPTPKVVFQYIDNDVNNSWKDLKNGENSTDIELTSQSEVSLTLTSEMLTNIKKNSLIIKGVNYTIGKVTLKTSENDENPTTIYEGSKENNATEKEVVVGDWKNYVQISKDKFNNASANCIVTIAVSNYSPQVEFCDKDWKSLGDAAVSDDKKSATLEVTSGILSKIQDNGMIVKGTNYKLEKVEVITTKTETTISEAQTAISSSSTLKISGSEGKFDKASANDILKFYLSNTESGAAIELKASGGSSPNILTSTSLSSGQEVYRLTLTESNIKLLQEYGLLICGDKFTCDKVTLISAATGSVIVDNYFDTNGKADLSKLSAQSDVSLNYDSTAKTAKITSTSDWTGVALSPFRTETVSGKELAITLNKGIQIKVAVDFSDGTSRMSIMDPDATSTETTYYFPLDGDKNISSIQIQPTAAQTAELTISNIQVNAAQTYAVFSDSKADLKKFVAISNDEYSFKSSTSDAYYRYTQKQTEATGIVLDIPSEENIYGTNKQVKITFTEAKKANVLYTINNNQTTKEMSEASTSVAFPLDDNNALTQIIIKGTATISVDGETIGISEVAVENIAAYEGTELVTAEGSEVASTAFPFQFKAESSLNAGDGTNWKKANFAASQFSSVKAGDKIYIYVAQADGCNIALQQYGGGDALPNGNNLAVADGKAVYELTASAAAFLKDNGASLTGQNYTVNKVTLVAGDGSASNAVSMDVANFYDITGGKRLYFGSGSTQAISGNKELTVTFSEATTAETTIEVTYVNAETAVSSKSAESGVTTIAIPLTSDATIKKIEVKSTGTITMSNIVISDTENPNERELYNPDTKEEVTNDGVTVAEYWKFGNAAVGDKIIVYGSDIAGSTTIALKGAGSNGKDSNNTAFNWTQLTSGSFTDSRFEYTLTTDDLTNLQANGLFIIANAGSFKIEKVTLISENAIPTSEPVALNEGDEEPDASTVDVTEVFSTQTALGNYNVNSVQVVATAFVNVKTNDYIKVYLSSMTDNSELAFQNLGTWENLTDFTTVKPSKNATKYVYKITSSSLTELQAGGLVIKGKDCTVDKIELLTAKSETPTAIFDSDGKADLSKMGVTNSMYVTYDPSTKTISSTKEWEGGVLTMEADENVKNEQLVVTLAEKGNAYIVVNYKEDGVTATERGIDNGTTTTLNLSDNYIKEIIIKATSGASAETPQTIKLASVVLQAKPVDNRTEHVLTSSAGTIGDWSGGPTFEAYQFANAEVGDRIVVTISELPDGDYHQIALQSNGSADKLGGTQNAVVGDYEVTLDADGLAELKANGLYVTGKYYTYSKIALWSENELGEEPKEDEISNTSATEAAKKVFGVLKDLYGKKIVSGVVANVDWNTKEAENVYGWTGKYPAMNVYDYINLHASKDVNSAGWVDYSDITTAKNWWKEGGIVGAMWHWQVKANNGTDYTCTPGTAAGETSFDASKVYVEGTSENTLAKQQLDQLCGYLKKMQDAGIPVVWRPLHEASGNVEQYSGGKAWFWWGDKGADVYKQLWQWMYNYMVKTKGLNNLIWVWTSQTNDNNWYPGDAYVDIIGRDNYGATAATLATEYEAQKAAYPNKMITLSECGNSESTEMAKLSSIWDAGSRWSWFMTWYDGDYNKGASTTHKHAGETWWKDAVSKDYVITRDKMKELLGQESSDDSKTGVNISLEDLNEGWSSSYNATTKTITTEGEWAARGWYIGDNRYNSKGSVTVKFEAVDFGVTLKMEYTNTGGESKSVSAGAAAGETGVELDIPADIKTMDKVYITYQPIGTLKLTAATVNDKVVDNRTERTLVEKSQAISDGDIAINRGLFSNAVAGDVLRIYADGLSESSKLALEPGDYSGAFDGANWTGFTESPFKLKLTATLIATIKEKGLLIRGESFTFKKAVLYTEKELGSEISDEEKKGDEEKDDDETIIDEKTGEADLTVLSAQDDTKTTLTENEDGSITMTTTEPYCAAQIWFNDPEPVAGNVLKVELAESKVNVTITVQYTDGTQSQMSANTSGVATARAATRGDSDPGTTIEVPLETGKEVQNIEVKNNVAGTITIKKMQVTTINIFTNGVANLSMLKPQSNATYDTSTHTLATTKGWTGATISPVGGENVSGKELLIEFADASKVKVAVKYRTDVEGPSTIMEKAAKAVRLALDNTKNIQEISIQPTEASIVTFKKIAVNSEESDDGTLKPGKTITLWESAAGETLSWNEVAKQDASVGEMLQEYDELLITISGVTEGCDWPKVFIRDASSEQAGNEVLLNDVGSFPYTVRIVLTGEMAQQLQKGFSICGDGVTVTKLQVYRPEAPKTGDIHLADLNYGYNSSYDKGTHTITTTARWAARGWEIGDKRYNDKNLITVKFEPVDFPVTLKMEYTTGLQTAQATSVGVPAGRTELLLEIPSGISKLDRVYIIYENPGSVKLTEASVTYQDKLKLSTAIEAFEAEGVIHDGRYDTDGWYNLRGMRIAEPKTSGIYIHGGKKVVIY